MLFFTVQTRDFFALHILFCAVVVAVLLHPAVRHFIAKYYICFINLFASSCIVLTMKFTMKVFPYAVTLTCMHLVVTFLFSTMRVRWKGETPSEVPRKLIVGLGVLYGLCIPSQNMCLYFNTIGTNQMAKLVLIPANAAVDVFRKPNHITREVFLWVLLIFVGSVYFSVSDINFNVVGASAAVWMICVTLLATLSMEIVQKEYNCPSSVLMSECLPYSIVTALLCAPFIDINWNAAEMLPKLVDNWFIIATSCILGVLINVSSFMIHGLLSALTYKVLGHTKTVAIFVGSVFVYNAVYSTPQLLGLVGAGAGICGYTWAQTRKSSALCKINCLNLPVYAPVNSSDENV